MTPLKWLLSFLLALGIGAGIWALFPRPVGQMAVPDAAKPVAEASEEVREFRDGSPVERVQELYARESQRIGEIDPDPEHTQQRLKELAQELFPQEIAWLMQEAMNPKTGGDGRFFATYLIALSGVPEAVAALGNMARSPLPEMKNKGLMELERQIRAQAVEGLGRSCGKQPQARDALLDVVEQQTDEFLRDRAHRALYQCRTGKPVEQQDREALEKVLYGN